MQKSQARDTGFGRLSGATLSPPQQAAETYQKKQNSFPLSRTESGQVICTPSAALQTLAGISK